MKLVLDSNIYIAAFATRGLCSELFEYCLKNSEIISFPEILSEIQNKLQTKIKLPEEIIAKAMDFINAETISIVPSEVSTDLCRDPKDLMVLGLALAANAKYIIAGDKDLLAIKNIGKTEIVNPRLFWEKTKG